MSSHCSLSRTSFVFALLLCAAGASARAADAAPDARPVPESFTFRFAPAELSTPAGVDDLYSRLARKARSACRVIDGGTALREAQLRRHCQAGLVDKVVSRIGKPALSARHAASPYLRLAKQAEDQPAQRTARSGGG